MNGSSRYVALLRGINVGTAKRIAMADLRTLFADLGFTGVRTLLQSGNVVFEAPSTPDAREIETAIHTVTGVPCRVLVVAESRFREIADVNPLLDVADDPSCMIVTFVEVVPAASALVRPTDAELEPECLVLGRHALYQWAPFGVMKSKLSPKFFAQLGPTATSRNLRTVTRILAMLDD